MIWLIVRFLPAALISGLAAVAIPAILARSLGPEQFGEYCLIVSSIQFAFYATTYWLVSSLIRFAPQCKGPIAVNRTMLVSALTSTGAAVVSVIAILPFVTESRVSPWTYLAISVSVLAQGLLLILGGIHRANERPLAYTLQKVATCGLPLLALFVLACLGATALDSTFVALACSYLIVLLFLGLPFIQWNDDLRGGAVPMRSMFIFGLPVAMTFFAEWVISASDRFLIGAMIGVEQTGLYAAPYTYAEQLIFFPLGVFQVALAPYNARVWHQHGPQAAVGVYSRQFSLLTLAVMPVVVVVALLGKSILVLVGSEAYLPAAPVMPWVAFAILFAGYQWISQRPLMMQNRTLRILAVFLIAAVINVAATALLLGPLGIQGAAIGTALAYASLFVLMHWLSATSLFCWRIYWGRLGIVWILAMIVTASVRLPVLTGWRLLLIGFAVTLASGLVASVIMFPEQVRRLFTLLHNGANPVMAQPTRPTLIATREQKQGGWTDATTRIQVRKRPA